MTTLRRIRPHKGGRTARAPQARIRPQTLERIHEAMREQGKTFADLLEETYQGKITMSQHHTIYRSDYKSQAAYSKDYQDLSKSYDYKVKVDDGKGGTGWMFFESRQDYDLWKRTK